MARIIIVMQGLFELSALSIFVLGYFNQVTALIIVGGILLILNDLVDILTGVLKPHFPVIFAIVLALIIRPWYVGIFWASALFVVLNIPKDLRKIFTPGKIISKFSDL